MDKKYWVALSSVENFESKFILALYEYFGELEVVFNTTDFTGFNTETKGAYAKKVEEFIKKRDSIDIDKVYNYVIERDLKIITFEDSDYPYMLKHIPDPPAILYYKGDFSVCNLEKTLAVVGSRRVSRNGTDSLKKVMKGLGGTDLCIVSGLAIGADTVAHRFALDNGLKTIGVIAGGMDNIYPSSNKALFNEIINGNGVIISEEYPTVEPLPFRFPKRNRIVSGLAYGTLVVEAAIKSGALITANLTLDQGRELMCIPGLITNPNTEGIYKLIKSGAAIVTNSDDILDTMGWTLNKQIKLFDNQLSSLSETELKIIQTIEIEPKTFDEIQTETNLPTDEILMYLTTLELNGVIEQTIGDRYKRC